MNHIFSSLKTQKKNQMQSLRVYLYIGTNSLLKIWSQLEKTKWILWWWCDGWGTRVMCFIMIPVNWIKTKNPKTQNVPHTSLSQQLKIWMRMYWLLMNFKFHKWEPFRIKILGEHAIWHFYKALRYGPWCKTFQLTQMDNNSSLALD